MESEITSHTRCGATESRIRFCGKPFDRPFDLPLLVSRCERDRDEDREDIPMMEHDLTDMGTGAVRDEDIDPCGGLAAERIRKTAP